SQYRDLLVAPVSLRSGLTQLIEREIAAAGEGKPTGIVIKVNAITDAGIVRLLYRASRAGVRIDLIVRGVCVLRPGVPGVSDHITVRSIVGRFLEHSRIFWFANSGTPQIYIGSADIMERNLDRRVEVLCPVVDPAMADHLRHVVLAAYLRDSSRSRVLTPDGTYVVPPEGEDPGVNAQELLLEATTMGESEA
ncbi:MAG: RNA degradosome polyphosphate kinase, partial [Acidobacteria bacterium]|nr:RNA degradosome polyphosphate kinase [Acidobacteriota bacterium]